MSSRRGRQPRSTPRYPRTARVNEVLREIVAEALERVADHDEALELVTITGVDADTDLRRATIFYSAPSAGADAALEEHRVRLQSEINRQTRLKRTPLLKFVEDPGISTGWRIEEVLREMKDEE